MRTSLWKTRPATSGLFWGPNRATSYAQQPGAHPGRDFSGTIGRLSPKLRLESRDQLVEVEIDNANGVLRPGMFAVAHLLVGEDKLPTVPITAVGGRAPSERVFVIKDARAEERIVSTGGRIGNRVAVKKGLATGEVVIARLSDAVRDGVNEK